MKKTLSLIISLIAIVHISFGQSPAITIGYNNFTYSHCLGSTYKLPVTIQGTFNVNNQYSVQVRQYYGQTLGATIPAQLKDGNLEFTFVNESLYLNPSIQLKVIASSPAIESEWSPEIRVFTKGNISLSSVSASDTVNIYENLVLNLKGFSTSQIYVTLSDSTKFEVYRYQNNFENSQNFTVSKSGTYSIAHAENGCGAMAVSGSVKAVVNPTSLQTVSATPTAICENGDVKIYFSANSAVFNAQTKYKIRFIQTDVVNPSKAEAPAQLVGNYLVAKFPKTFVLTDSRNFMAQVITDNPALVGSTNNVMFSVYPSPSVSFTSQSKTINIGYGATNLEMNLKGLPPFDVELTDGSKQTFSWYGSVNMYVSPSKNTTYSIKSFTSGCGKTNITNPQSLAITVEPGIRFAASPTIPNFCAGSKARIKFESSVELTSATTFRIVSNGNQFPVADLKATRVGEYLEFDIPANTQLDDYQVFKIVTTNPSLESQYTGSFRIQSRPTIAFESGMKTSYDVPGNVSVYYRLAGGWPYTVESTVKKTELADGYNWNSESFFLKETTNFQIKSVSNSCFKNETPVTARISLTNTESPGIYIEPLPASICGSDSLEVTFGTVGKFEPQNTYAIQVYSDCCQFSTVATAQKGGKYRIKIPVSQYSYYYNAQVRVASTNPVIFSEAVQVTLHHPIETATINSVQGTEESPAILYNDQSNYLSLYFTNSSANQINYTENNVDKVFQLSYASSSASIPIKPATGVNTTYVIKSVTNNCGTKPLNITSVVRLLPYRLVFSQGNYSSNNYCTGAPISIPFGVTDGTPAADVSFSLQIRKRDSKEFITLQSGEKGRIINATIPDNIEAGTYTLRLISSDGAIALSPEIQVSAKATATLSAPSGSTTVEAGNGVSLKIAFTGTPPFKVIFEDGSKPNYYNLEDTRWVTPQKGGQFSIKSVSNGCGYGTASGTVNITIKPSLYFNSNSSAICENSTFSTEYNLRGDVDLSNDYIRFELVDISNNTFVVLDSTKQLSGTKQIKIPGELKGAQYQLRCTVRKYNLSSSLYTNITTKPDISLSGGTIINKGESAQLLVRSNKRSNDLTRFELSDGTKGEFWGSYLNYPYYVSVSPSQTTSYTIKSASNTCGEGVKNGSARVEVNPASELTVSTRSWYAKFGQSACIGDTITVDYVTTGNFSAENRMTVQISDSTGFNFQPVTTIGTTSPLKAIIPTKLVSGRFYRVRVSASDPNSASGANVNMLSASQKAKARFESSFVAYDPKVNPKIVILFEGGAPWTYTYGSDIGTPVTRITQNPSEQIELYQASPSQYYKIFSVSNGCGPGIIGDPSTVRVEVVTGIEPAPQFDVTVYPNPAQEVLRIDLPKAGDSHFQLLDARGTILLKTTSHTIHEEIDIRQLPTGIYMLRIESGETVKSFKVIKQ